jgi:hypothetical protein
MTKPSPVESEETIAVIRRDETTEIRVRLVKLLTGQELIDVRKWRKTWRGAVPDKGLTLRIEEGPEVAAALQRGAGK